MFINKDSLIINNVSMGSYLTSIRYGRNKLWADDTGRNLEGDFSGTLKGIFPKFILRFRKLNQTELETITDILDSATQTVQYYSTKKRAMNTITTYSGDWEYEDNTIGINEPFECSLIVRSREV